MNCNDSRRKVTTCKPGQIAGVDVACTDNSAVGIQSITQSQDGTELYVALTNGLVDTFTLPQGEQGGPGADGKQGNTGASGANGYFVISDTFPNVATTTAGSFETLKTEILIANQLSTNQDSVELMAFYIRSPLIARTNTPYVRVLFNNQTLVLSGFLPGFNASNVAAIKYRVLMTRIGSTSVTFTLNITVYTDKSNNSGSFSYSAGADIIQAPATIAGLDLINNAYQFSIQADSVDIGDVALVQSFFAYNHKS